MDKVTKSLKIDPEVWHRARVKALSENMTLQELIVKLLTEYLGEGKKKAGK
jgi:macrodomain Ter protein organizer (MatP/YcbG family)